MPLPYPSTIDRARVFANVGALESEGHPRRQAIAIAFAAARAAYFKRFPSGALPVWMAAKKGARLARHYSTGGALIDANPVPPSRVLQAKRLYTDFTGHTPDDAVSVKVSGAGFKTGFIVGRVLALELTFPDTAKKWCLDFTKPAERPALCLSHDGKRCVMIDGDFGPLHEDAAELDNLQIAAIMYETVRDGRAENYRHPFRPNARPLITVLDGRNAKMHGGAFRFTDRGFIDLLR